jgi:hypothetical protein
MAFLSLEKEVPGRDAKSHPGKDLDNSTSF